MFNRLKARTKKDWLIIGITSLALLLLLSKAIHLGWRIFGPEKRVAVHQVERLDYQAGLAWATSFFGAEPIIEVVQPEPVPTADVKVFGIISSARESATYALLLINGQRRDLFSVGDEIIPGLTVSEITASAVILQNASGEIIIPLVEETAKNLLLTGMSETSTVSNAGSSNGLIISGNETRSARRARGEAPVAAPQPSAMPSQQPVTPSQQFVPDNPYEPYVPDGRPLYQLPDYAG